MDPQFQAFIQGLIPTDWHRIAVDVERPHGWGCNSPRVLNALTYILHSIAGWHGRRPFIYTARGVWNHYYSTGGEFAEFPLWVANYQRANPVLPAGWSDYAIWQYSADGNKLGPYYGLKSMSVDLDTAKAL
jgi:lysozyme